ncbi:MAG: SDR family oxidoreductase [Oscillospiraceae bacterium]|nr:SDR family oxidoreductase [Oscillospiraceae bacterium]
MNNLFDVSGKKAIVTGASRGLGKAMAQALHDAGVTLVIMGTNEKVVAVANEMTTAECPVYPVMANFKDNAAVAAAFDEAMQYLDHDIDIMVNNAGMQVRYPCLEFPIEEWNKVLNVNLTSAFILAQLAGQIMAKKGYGKIVNTASLLSYQGGFTVPAYAAAKGGIKQMTMAFSNELASVGVNVNAIAPGYMDTDNIAALKADEARLKTLMDRIPAKRLGTPEDLVGALIFLSSHASDYVNGVVVTVDGGWMGR